MLQAFVVTFREGLEAFLIVAISLSYLRRTGREHLALAVYWGIAAAMVFSAVVGYIFSFAANQSLWEGALALVASVLVGSLILHMWRAAHTLKRSIHDKLEIAAEGGSSQSARLGVFCFIVLMITREGMETALLLGTLLFQMKAPIILSGAIGGIVAASLVALLWSRYGNRVDLRRFLQVTAVFLLIFVTQLLIYGVHELAEANVLPHSSAIHDATEPYGPGGSIGHLISYGLLVIPLGWLLVSYCFGSRSKPVKEGNLPAFAQPRSENS